MRRRPALSTEAHARRSFHEEASRSRCGGDRPRGRSCCRRQAAPFALGPTTVASGPSPFAPGCGGPGEASPRASTTRTPRWRRTSPSTRPMRQRRRLLAAGPLVGRRLARKPRRLLDRRRRHLGAQRAARSRAARAARARRRRRLPARDRPVAVVQPERPPARDLDRLRQLDGTQRGPGRLLRQRRRDLERAADPALRQSARGRQQLQRQGDADRRPVQLALVYATWQRIVSPSERRPRRATSNASSFYSEAWFARSTNGGASWEPARSIFRDRGKLKQTIGNVVEVLPDGTLINGFNLIRAITQPARHARLQRRAHSLPRQGRDLVARDHRQPAARRTRCTTPTTGHDVRTGDILPTGRSIAAPTRQRAATSTSSGWTRRFNDADHNDILLARSTDGGLTWSAPGRGRPDAARRRRLHALCRCRRAGPRRGDLLRLPQRRGRRRRLSTDFWITHSHDGGRTFPTRTGSPPTSFDMRTAPDALGYFVGDYTGLAHFGTAFHPAGSAPTTATSPTAPTSSTGRPADGAGDRRGPGSAAAVSLRVPIWVPI